MARRAASAIVIVAALVAAPASHAQDTARPPARAERVEVEPDTLGRDTPRGTLLGFMAAARAGNLEAATLYLDTDLRDAAAAGRLAHELYVVLDLRLPARLNELSDKPDGSRANPLKPDQDVVGTIATSEGPLDVVVRRMTRGGPARVWLFARPTLDAIPRIYDEVHLVSIDAYVPRLARSRIGGIRLFEWVAFFVAIPALYYAIGVIGLLFSPARTLWRRRRGLELERPSTLPGAVRLFVLALTIRWLVSSLEMPLLERQIWSATARLLASAAVVWVGLRINAYGERHFQHRLHGSTVGDTAALLRLARRVADVIVVLTGGLLVLHYFGVDPSAALAGLGIGGIAVALAAQKTLENVIGGLSIVFDKAVRVGDILKLGDITGTVDYIGLRSTRIRTLDRTVLTVPNGQIATANIETLSLRDKFWFHHYMALGYGTPAAQVRGIVGDVAERLRAHPRVDATAIRARLLRFGPFSIDIEVFAYLYTPDWDHFLELQEALLLELMEIVERRGAAIALPSQTVHVAAVDVAARPASRVGS